jgi:hypothetical protein
MNGSGHFSRIIAYARELSSRSVPVTIVASSGQATKFQVELRQILEKPKNRVFEIALPCGLDGPQWTPPRGDGISELDPSLVDDISRASLTLSDNVIWPSKIARKFVLLGHFLWADYWRSTNLEGRQELVTSEESLIRGGNWRWLKNPEFGIKTSTIQANRQKSLPLYFDRSDKSASDLPIKDEIWISRGTTGLPFALGKEWTNGNTVWPIRYAETFEIFVRGFRPRLVVARPGVGTIRDCIARGVPLYLQPDMRDFELDHNVERMMELGLGFSPYAVLDGGNFSGRAAREMLDNIGQLFEAHRDLNFQPIQLVVDQILKEGEPNVAS